jgi:hypothetical protein
MATIPGLEDHHHKMLSGESGIADTVIAERGYRSLDATAGYAELKPLGFSPQQARQTPGLLLPLHTTAFAPG